MSTATQTQPPTVADLTATLRDTQEAIGEALLVLPDVQHVPEAAATATVALAQAMTKVLALLVEQSE